MENKKEKAFSPPSFFSAILAQNRAPRPLPGPRASRLPLPSLSLSSMLTGGAHPSGSSLPPNRRSLHLSRLETAQAEAPAPTFSPPLASASSWIAPTRPSFLPPPHFLLSLPLLLSVCAKKRRRRPPREAAVPSRPRRFRRASELPLSPRILLDRIHCIFVTPSPLAACSGELSSAAQRMEPSSPRPPLSLSV